MKYGIPSLMEFSDPRPLVEFCAEQGFDFVELNLTYPWFQRDTLDVKALQRWGQESGIAYTLHLHDQVNPFEFSPEMQEAAMKNILWALKVARELSIPRITMHLMPGMYSSISGTKVYLYQHCIEKYLAGVERFRDTISQRLEGTDTLFCIENTNGYQAFHKAAIDLMLASPAFALTYDIGHDYKIGNADAPFMLERKDRIRHFHIHDCDARANHLALGLGEMDIPHYVSLAQALNCSAVIEIKESHALHQSREYLRKAGMWKI